MKRTNAFLGSQSAVVSTLICCSTHTMGLYACGVLGNIALFLYHNEKVRLEMLSPSCTAGNGTPLQYSCLENPMNRGAWWAAVHGVAKSRTRLSDFTFTFHFHALEKAMATHSSVLAWRTPGTGSLVGCRLWGRTESDTTEVTWQQQQRHSRQTEQRLESSLRFFQLCHSIS